MLTGMHGYNPVNELHVRCICMCGVMYNTQQFFGYDTIAEVFTLEEAAEEFRKHVEEGSMRGQRVGDGATRVAPNGYGYTKVHGQWRMNTHIVAEQKIGRPLHDDERVVVLNKSARANPCPDDVQVVKKGKASVRRRIAQLEARIAELQAELDHLRRQET